MRFIIVGMALLLAHAVQAQESRVVEGCLATIANFAGAPPDQVGRIDDFSELEPPRARVSFSIGSRSSYVTCEFANRESPLGLAKVCFESVCLSPEDGTAKRFEELRYLLAQSGL